MHPLFGYKPPQYRPVRPTVKNDLSQSEARTWMPPKTYIWRANTKFAWASRCPPHKAHTEPWIRHDADSFNAMWACVVSTWHEWLSTKRLDISWAPDFVIEDVKAYRASLDAEDGDAASTSMIVSRSLSIT